MYINNITNGFETHIYSNVVNDDRVLADRVDGDFEGGGIVSWLIANDDRFPPVNCQTGDACPVKAFSQKPVIKHADTCLCYAHLFGESDWLLMGLYWAFDVTIM